MFAAAFFFHCNSKKQKNGLAILPKYVKIYRELGGEIITIGSDAHCVENLGKGIPEGIQIAKNCGFDKIYYYDHRKPVSINI